MSHFVLESKAHNKAFKSDSQRLALSLRSSIAKRRSPLNAALYALGVSEQDVFDTSNIGCYLPVI
ncbi:hypothetical protein BSR61_25400 [Vibrio parahaemolyticus]|nr:hypothetical protein BSR61_25400 [Vibrio parahaemolyticus]PMT73754.1 hypothetical protein C1S97_26085 [Vibrio parahaemolyticus]